MPCPGLESVAATNPARRARGSPHDRRAFIVRLVRRRGYLARGPAAPRELELAAVPLRTVALEERAVLGDTLDDRFSRSREDRAAFGGVAVEQARATPAVQHGGQLPAEVDRVLEPGVEPVSAVRRMAVRRIAGDEHAALPVAVSDVDAQIPEPHVLEVARHAEPGGPLDQRMRVEAGRRRGLAYRRVEEPRLRRVHPPEEPPVALELGMQHTVRGPQREALQALVQLAGPEDRQDHALIEVRSAAGYAGLLAHLRMRAVAPDDVVSLDLATPRAGVPHRRHAHAVAVLPHARRRPPEQRGDRGELAHPVAQHRFGQV